MNARIRYTDKTGHIRSIVVRENDYPETMDALIADGMRNVYAVATTDAPTQKSQSNRAELQQVGYAVRQQCRGMNGR